MTDAAALVKALRDGRTWQRVADLCNDGTGMHHSAGYYQQVATGRIQEPNDATRQAITQAASNRLLRAGTYGFAHQHRDIGRYKHTWHEQT